MKTTTKSILVLTGMFALGLTAVRAQTDAALLDALVKKGVLSDQEAQDIRTDEAKAYATTPAGKLAISNYVTQLKLYGDGRFRSEYMDEKPQSGATTAGDNIVERNRYRLRVGLDETFTDNLTGGFELETNTANDSANQSFGNAYNKAAINVGLIYLQWKPLDWLTLTGGKQHNPLYTTDLVWDPDINPEGGSEAASWTFPIGGGEPAPRDPKDMKAMAPAPSDMSLTIGFTAFQGIMYDNNEANTSALDNVDVWQFVEQVPIQFNFDKNTFIKEVPGFDTYMGGGNTGGSSSGGGTNNFTSPIASDDLAIITAPGEVDWKLWNEPFKVYWDFAANLDGKQRIQSVYLDNDGNTAPGASAAARATAANTQVQNGNLGDNVAWLAGLQVGQNKKKGDWSIKGDFRQVGLGAIDPNLNDSDWGDSFLNQQGIKLQSTYNFTDFLTGSLTYYDTWDYKTNLFNGTAGQTPTSLPVVTGAAGGTPTTNGAASIGGLAGASTTQRVQVDLMWKF
jgi:hypothetical protein